MKGDLFCNIPTGTAFHYGDKPDRILVKADDRTQLSTDGFKTTHPHVLVFGEEPQTEARKNWVRQRSTKS